MDIFRKKENFIILNAEMSNDHKVFLTHKSLVKRIGKFKASLAFFIFSFKKDKCFDISGLFCEEN